MRKGGKLIQSQNNLPGSVSPTSIIHLNNTPQSDLSLLCSQEPRPPPDNSATASTPDPNQNHDLSNKSPQIKCLLFNARSIRNKMSEFRSLVANEHFDMIAVTETFISLNNDLESEYSINNFKLFYLC